MLFKLGLPGYRSARHAVLTTCVSGLAVLSLSSAALALPRIQLQPAQVLRTSDGTVRVATAVPCGTHFFGLVAVAEAASSTLHLAAAVVEDAIVCTSMPKPLLLNADYLGINSFAHVEAIPVDERLHVRLVGIDEVRSAGLASRGKNAAGPALGVVSSIYTPHCGRFLGTLIRQGKASGSDASGALGVQLAIVEADPAPNQKAVACTTAPVGRSLSFLTAAAALRSQPLRERPKSLVRSYELRLLAPTQLQRTATGGLTATYSRACNEAPIGLAVAVAAVSAGGPVGAGVLVAHYFNLPCPEGLPLAAPATLTEDHLYIPAARPLVAMPQVLASRGLRLRAPTSLELKRGAQGRQAEIAYLGGCEQPLAVYANGGRDTLAIGVLTVAAATPGAATGSGA